MPDVGILDLPRLGIESRQGGHRADEHPHGMRIVPKAVHEALDLLVDDRVMGDVPGPVGQLVPVRKLPVQQQVGDLEERVITGQLLDRIAAVAKDPALSVDKGNRALARGGVGISRVVCHEPEVVLGLLDRPQVRGGDRGAIGGIRSVYDRKLVSLTGAVVDDRDAVGHRDPPLHETMAERIRSAGARE